MGKEKSEQKGLWIGRNARREKTSSGKTGAVIVNLLGILSAFGIAVGGLLLVQVRLEQEEKALLQGGGMIKQMQSGAAAAMIEGEESVEQAQLTDAQLYRVVKELETEVEAYPHEPWEGQLSMVEAVECAREWIEEILLPGMGINDYKLPEYSINCYLWAWQADVEAGDRDPILSYWNMWINSPGLSVDLTLNAATGQVLYATVTSSSILTEYQNRKEQVAELLYAYADSFGLEGRYTIYDAGDGITERSWSLYEGIGSEGVYAVAKTTSFIAARSDGYTEEFMEIFSLELGLGTE